MLQGCYKDAATSEWIKAKQNPICQKTNYKLLQMSRMVASEKLFNKGASMLSPKNPSSQNVVKERPYCVSSNNYSK